MTPQLRFLAGAGSDEQGGYSDPHAGFFVPEGMTPQVLTVNPEVDPTAERITPVPMTTQVVKTNARVDKNHSASVSGGLTVSRRAETQQPGASRQEYEQVKLEATALFGIAYASEQVLERSPVSFAALLDAGFKDEFGSKALGERIAGTGNGEPLGVLNSPCKISVAKEGSQVAHTINGTNIVKMRKRCWRYGQAIWLANHNTYEQLLKAHVTGPNDDVFLFNPAPGTARPSTPRPSAGDRRGGHGSGLPIQAPAWSTACKGCGASAAAAMSLQKTPGGLPSQYHGCERSWSQCSPVSPKPGPSYARRSFVLIAPPSFAAQPVSLLTGMCTYVYITPGVSHPAEDAGRGPEHGVQP